MCTSTGICRIAVGTRLRFTPAAGPPPGLNLHAAGVILPRTTVLGLLLLPWAGGASKPGRLLPWIHSGGCDNSAGSVMAHSPRSAVAAGLGWPGLGRGRHRRMAGTLGPMAEDMNDLH